MTPAEQLRQATPHATTGRPRPTSFDSWENLNALERCITRGMPGTMLNGVFDNHNYRILQTPDYIAVVAEMIHDARIIPLDGRGPLPPTIRQWLGDARGYWKGNTLVVETTNFNDKIRHRVGTMLGGDQYARVTERFTRTGIDTIDYRITVTDPTVWTQPWTASLPMRPQQGELYEWACHEGNYGVINILGGSRAQERALAQDGR